METVSRETAQLDPWYVTGLIDGIGTFTYSRSGRQLAVYFGVKASTRALDELRDFFGVGAIYNVRGSDYYRVQRRDELPTIVDHFDRYVLRAKREAFEVWRQMVTAKQEFRQPDRDRLEQLAVELSNLSRR